MKKIGAGSDSDGSVQRIGSRGGPCCPDLYQGSDDDAPSRRAGPASTSSAAAAADCGTPMTRTVTTGTGTCILGINQRQGGDGWFGTVGAGYDWQFNSGWVAGIFADGQFGSIKGTHPGSRRYDCIRAQRRTGLAMRPASRRLSGRPERSLLCQRWIFRARIGRLNPPHRAVWLSPVAITPIRFTRNGLFIGGGVENKLDIFGITIPGWFMKTEYRAAYYGTATSPETFPDGYGDRSTRHHVQGLERDHQHLAGLSFQLERRPVVCEILIFG